MGAPANSGLSEELSMHIRKCAHDFEKDVKRFVSTKAQLAQASADEALMNDVTRGRRYPSGVRPFKSASEKAELDEPWNESRDADYVITVHIPAATSRREVMSILHHTTARIQKSIEVQQLQDHF
jgi:hypothetical protein